MSDRTDRTKRPTLQNVVSEAAVLRRVHEVAAECAEAHRRLRRKVELRTVVFAVLLTAAVTGAIGFSAARSLDRITSRQVRELFDDHGSDVDELRRRIELLEGRPL